MNRLSINDMNNLSGINEELIDELYRGFKRAHCKVLNDAVKWERKYLKHKDLLNKMNYDSMKLARKLYYEGSIIVDEIDLFKEASDDYISIRYKLKTDFKEIYAYQDLLIKEKTNMLKFIRHCYNVWDETSLKIYKEEE